MRERPKKEFSRKELRDILLRNWLTHDALWYGEVASRFGMTEASPMNLRVCRKLGQIECHRVMKILEAGSPKNIEEYRERFDMLKQVFVPDFMKFQIEYPSEDSQIFHVQECFAYTGMEKAETIADYECGIFERIEGWFDTMGLKYTRTPDLSRCLKFRGKDCTVVVRFSFK